VSKYVIKFSLRLAYEDRLQHVQISDLIGSQTVSHPPPLLPSGFGFLHSTRIKNSPSTSRQQRT
jgi:hypothetical protein